ncbi:MULTISPECIES: hypothetical protein [Deinococcus]|uniref:Lipoprotein n=1 Tax=Deinococcus cavernae TaxID=2320857 RepID=A0A418VAP8_9DEIO|nr:MULTISPECIES: hypothetical protein [Deinococcus]RJF73195.1 hypothetical protein D3875_18205 [Deinococcus cavernae]
MKRLSSLLLAPLLAGCGSLSAAPTAGELLDAPTTLNIAGKPVKADAFPRLNRDVFSVKVRLSTSRAALPGLKVTDMYVVTGDGVWTADNTTNTPWKCPTSCVIALGRGAANGLKTGAGVQVILNLQDSQGRQYLLRDAQAQVK